MSKSFEKVFFLTGVGRSGTSLLQSMLHAHPQMHLPPETHFFKRYILPLILRGRKISPDHLCEDLYLKRLPEALREEIIAQDMTGLDAARAAFLKIMGAGETSLAGDKDTEYVRYLPHLQTVFPGSFLIHIVRDPRDVVASRMKAAWSRKRGFLMHVAEYQYYIRQVEALGPVLFGKRYLTLRYEDLLAAPEETLKGLCEKMGLEFSASMLEYYQHSESLVAADEASWKQNLSKPLLSGNHGKWRETLSQTQALLVQDGIEKTMEQHGYDRLPGRASFGRRVLRNLLVLLFRYKTRKEALKEL